MDEQLKGELLEYDGRLTRDEWIANAAKDIYCSVTGMDGHADLLSELHTETIARREAAHMVQTAIIMAEAIERAGLKPWKF